MLSKFNAYPDGIAGAPRRRGADPRAALVLLAAAMMFLGRLLIPAPGALAFPSGPAGTIATYETGLTAPTGAAVDAAGNLYVAEATNCDLLKIPPGGGPPTVLIGGGCGSAPSQLNHPGGVAVDATTVFVADTGNCQVKSVLIPGGVPSIVAGTGTCGFAGDGGAATAAELNSPEGVAVDAAGDVFIADTSNCRVREVTAGTISTLTGNGTCSPTVAVGQSAGGAPIGPPTDIAVSGTTPYVITGAITGECQEFGVSPPPTPIITGPVFNDFSCATQSGNHVAVSSTGIVYASFAELSSFCEVKAVPSNSVSQIVAGMSTCGYAGDGGPATSAEIGSTVGGITTDGAGNLYISDNANNVMRIVYAPVFCSSSPADPDANCDTDFSNPGAGMPCVQDHIGDANNDGYSDSDALTPPGAQTCTGAYPASGGFGTDPASTCAGRNLLGSPAQVAAAKVARADVDLSGKVTILDLSAAASAYGQSGFASNPNDRRNEFDQDGSGAITILDLSKMAGAYGQMVPPC